MFRTDFSVLFRSPSLAVALLAVAVSCPPATAIDPRIDAGGVVNEQPPRPARRSHIQSAGEIVAAPKERVEGLGMRLSRASPVLRQQLALTRGAGLVVEDVAPGSRAARAGFKQHDVLVMLDDQLLLLPEQLAALLEAATAEAPLQCTVLRAGRKVRLPLAVATAAAPGPGATLAGLRPTESSLQIIRDAGRGVPPTRRGEESQADAPGRLARIASETLLRQDSDFQIRLTGGEEMRLLVTDNRGRVIFDDTIDTPEARSRMPVVVRQRVEEMEKSLERRSRTPAAEIGRLDVAPLEVR